MEWLVVAAFYLFGFILIFVGFIRWEAEWAVVGIILLVIGVGATIGVLL